MHILKLPCRIILCVPGARVELLHQPLNALVPSDHAGVDLRQSILAVVGSDGSIGVMRKGEGLAEDTIVDLLFVDWFLRQAALLVAHHCVISRLGPLLLCGD